MWVAGSCIREQIFPLKLVKSLGPQQIEITESRFKHFPRSDRLMEKDPDRQAEGSYAFELLAQLLPEMKIVLGPDLMEIAEKISVNVGLPDSEALEFILSLVVSSVNIYLRPQYR